MDPKPFVDQSPTRFFLLSAILNWNNNLQTTVLQNYVKLHLPKLSMNQLYATAAFVTPTGLTKDDDDLLSDYIIYIENEYQEATQQNMSGSNRTTSISRLHFIPALVSIIVCIDFTIRVETFTISQPLFLLR